MYEDTNYPAYKFMTDNLQLMLINIWFRSISEQGSIVTSLRCDGIFNDQCITESVQSRTVKEFRKSVNICRSYGQESSVLFFCDSRSIKVH